MNIHHLLTVFSEKCFSSSYLPTLELDKAGFSLTSWVTLGKLLNILFLEHLELFLRNWEKSPGSHISYLMVSEL